MNLWSPLIGRGNSHPSIIYFPLSVSEICLSVSEICLFGELMLAEADFASSWKRWLYIQIPPQHTQPFSSASFYPVTQDTRSFLFSTAVDLFTCTRVLQLFHPFPRKLDVRSTSQNWRRSTTCFFFTNFVKIAKFITAVNWTRSACARGGHCNLWPSPPLGCPTVLHNWAAGWCDWFRR